MKAKILRIYMLMALSISVFLLIVLGGFEILPVTNGNDDLVILQQANLQVVRVQICAKDVLILEYGSGLYHSQAVNELQTVLPNFRNTQSGLLNGNPSLGLPGNPSGNVTTLLNSAQPDYLAVVAAIDNILLHPGNTPDPTQVNIVVQHEWSYTLTMYQVALALQNEAEARKIQQIVIKVALIIIIELMVILKYFLFTRKVVNEKVEAEKKRESSNGNETSKVRNKADDV